QLALAFQVARQGRLIGGRAGQAGQDRKERPRPRAEGSLLGRAGQPGRVGGAPHGWCRFHQHRPPRKSREVSARQGSQV
ncbi:uncharacterized protein METZ01_LOCUS202628, partial [marine metagenome]